MKTFRSVERTNLSVPMILSVLLLLSSATGIQAQQLSEETSPFDSFVAEATTLSAQIDSLPHKIICLGNSITLHQPLEDINWFSRHGMAASRPENDYCHVLEKLMHRHNARTTVTPFNFSDWERDFDLDLDTLFGDVLKDKDIIVIRIGENVRDLARFSEALSRVITYCSQYTSDILLTSMYWPDAVKEEAILSNARKYGLKYVPIWWIWNLFREECSPKEGDILYDVDNRPYPIEGDFILTHPNDKGMFLIAKSIYSVIGK